ncbi:smoothelin, like isoform X2 [Electrophorus electricus]|uniref:smoothelin, like isoform X2 n=1 Tax=Electrophorus electricus TaxID=8005 RepID=UPI0015CFE2AE|nr:smoothelin, like isoform X2 [Electrophorus electricus]
MDAGPLAAVGEGSPEGETVCAALARYEATLRDAVREIHVDVSAFKLGVEQRLEEALHMNGPLGRAVAQLQQENRQLRGQLEALTRQVEMLTGTVCDRSALLGHGGAAGAQSPPSPSGAAAPGPGPASSPSIARFSSRATISVSSKASSIEREEPIEVDLAPAPSAVENGHASIDESSPAAGMKRQNSSPVFMAMPHLPITATTKVADSLAIKGPESPSSPMQTIPPAGTDSQPDSQPDSPTATSGNQPQLESTIHAVSSVKSWTPSPVRTMGSPRLTDTMASSAPPKAVAYSGYSGLNQYIPDRNVDVPGELSFGRGVERRRELVRSQTLPRSLGAQARRTIFERLDSENASRPKPVDPKPKLKRSQSFGVSSASSIKQILLEWCRSKTIGYQNIDIQNFSSSWSDGMAFCALVHSFFPTEFDYNALSPADRKHNFELAFSTAEQKAGCDRLIEVEDMMVMGRKPDPMCVFTYVQSLYNHLRKFE